MKEASEVCFKGYSIIHNRTAWKSHEIVDESWDFCVRYIIQCLECWMKYRTFQGGWKFLEMHQAPCHIEHKRRVLLCLWRDSCPKAAAVYLLWSYTRNSLGTLANFLLLFSFFPFHFPDFFFKNILHMWSKGMCWSQHIPNVVKKAGCAKKKKKKAWFTVFLSLAPFFCTFWHLPIL